MSAAEQFRVDEVSPSYWRVTFDNGPVNLLDPDTIDQLGAGSEFVLATDIRFASEKAVLGQFEVGAVPGGGAMARLGRLVGRGRALEILLGGDDIPASLAAEYGYVNRVIPDDQIEGFTDAFARSGSYDRTFSGPDTRWSDIPHRMHRSAETLVKFCTKRFRGNAADTPASA
jgi:enoyl-CoA hydratase/carnithine racemase